jgi:two-component system phosphate regulon sensor histidine kinase PhoR
MVLKMRQLCIFNPIFSQPMKHKNIRVIVVLALISIISIVLTQTYWFTKAFDLREKQFNHNVTIALQNTAEALIEYQKLPVPLDGLVTRVSDSYYVVSVNGEISTELLEVLLRCEFKKRNILTDFEYGIYNCHTKCMLYGNYISFGKKTPDTKSRRLSAWKDDRYYFAVYFPNKDSGLVNQMGVWIFISCVLLFVCFFFAYTTFVVLKQKRLSDIQKDFINNMTHEFKTPLATIQITSELLKKPGIHEDSGSVGHYTDIIQFEVAKLKDHVEQILRAAVFDKEKIRYDFTETNLHVCIEKAVKSAGLMIDSRQGTVKTTPGAVNPFIYADETHITNVIFNLVDNALKYVKTRPEILIRTENSGKWLVLTITDNGPGIRKECQRKIFDKFYRVPTGNLHDVKGFGLGLYYVKSMVKIHRGKITVKSRAGEGTTFTIQWPVIPKK